MLRRLAKLVHHPTRRDPPLCTFATYLEKHNDPLSLALPATATATEKLFLVEMVITRLVTHATMSDGVVVSPPPVTATTGNL